MATDDNPIVSVYQRHAEAWDRQRSRGRLVERPWLDRLAALLPSRAKVLDVGCGSGVPIARHFIQAGHTLTGIDASRAMIGICRRRFPDTEWIVADMCHLALGRRFHGIIAWDSFFHLGQDDQRRMLAVLGDHALPGAALLLTTGPRDGEAMGAFAGEPLYHASLAPEEYWRRLAELGFAVVAFRAEDPDCGGHTVWLVKRGS